MSSFTPQLKHHILKHYSAHSRDRSFAALARLYAVPGGKQTVQQWHRRWNGSPASLENKARSGRPRALTRRQVNDYIRTPIKNKRRAHAAVHYPDLLPALRQKIGKQISLRTLQRYGKEELGIKLKHTQRRTASECECIHPHTREKECARVVCCALTCVSGECACRAVSASLCVDIAELRKRIQRHSKERVLFLDETAMRLNAAPTSTLVLPGEDAYVIAEDTTSYAKRFDMIACINGSKVFPPMIFSPQERADAGVKGINKKMLVKYIQDILAQAVGALDEFPIILTLDKANIHKGDLLQEFHDMGCQDVQHIWLMPTQAAKRMSPLDNALFHDWKERVRKHGPLTMRNIQQVMADEWNNITQEQIQPHYRHCLLTSHHNPYADCPAPAAHRHES